MKRVNTLWTGATQIAGKSTSALAFDVVPCIEDDDCAIIIADPPATLGIKAAGHTLEMGMSDRLILLDLERSLYGGFGMFAKSKATNRHERSKENRLFARGAADSLTVHRIGAGIDDTRIIKDGSSRLCVGIRKVISKILVLFRNYFSPTCLAGNRSSIASGILRCDSSSCRSRILSEARCFSTWSALPSA